MTTLGIDVSHWQGSIDWPQVKASGHHFALLKATESTNYTDPTFAANRAAARKAGLVTGAYHFARYQDPIAEADRFCNAVGTLASGELAVLDWEIDAADPVTWSRRWLDRVRERLGVKAFVYMNQFHRSKWAWKQIADLGHPLWLAKYDGVTDQPPGGPWPVTSMKQFTDKGKVPGIAGGVDLNVFYGDLKALAKHGKDGTDLEDDMPLTDADVTKIFWGTPFKGDENFAQVIHRLDDLAAELQNRTRDVERGGEMIPMLQEIADAKTLGLQLTGQIAGLTKALEQLAANPGQKVDLAAVQAAARAGAEEALANGVDVDVTVGGKPAESA